MLHELLLDVQAEVKAVRKELVHTNEKVEDIAQTLVSIRRELRSLQTEVATLGTAVDGHTRRLDQVEQHLGIGATAN